jgi:intergrase/recombinase
MYALKEDTGVSEAFAWEWVNEVNKTYEEPKNEEELEKAFRSIFER